MNQRLYDISCGRCGETLWADHFPQDGFVTVCHDCVVDIGACDNEYLPEEVG
jgi:hypothetical protein